MKETELKLISELMKNSRRSDRELAKAIGTSQPTVSRMIQKLEKQGIISEYTMIPDFTKLGYSLLTMTRSRARSRRKLTRDRDGRDKWAWGMMRWSWSTKKTILHTRT